MTTRVEAFLVGAAVISAGLITAAPASAKVIVAPVFNAANPGGAFTPSDPLGTILNTPLKKPNTYDFTFTLSGISAGSTNQVQLQAAAQTLMGSTPEPLNYDLFSGTPGSTTSLITASNFVAASGPTNTVGQVISAMLGNGSYYVQVAPSQIAVSGEIGSGSITEMAVPEPMAWSLMLVGFAGVGGAIRRRAARTVAVAG